MHSNTSKSADKIFRYGGAVVQWLGIGCNSFVVDHEGHHGVVHHHYLLTKSLRKPIPFKWLTLNSQTPHGRAATREATEWSGGGGSLWPRPEPTACLKPTSLIATSSTRRGVECRRTRLQYMKRSSRSQHLDVIALLVFLSFAYNFKLPTNRALTPHLHLALVCIIVSGEAPQKFNATAKSFSRTRRLVHP